MNSARQQQLHQKKQTHATFDKEYNMLQPVPIPRGIRDTVNCDVILPYCERDQEYLLHSAESILNQNAAVPILHLVADGFEPGVYEKQIAREKNVYLYRTPEPVGPYVAAMMLWDEYQTPYLAIQDADDISLPNRLWDAVTQLNQSGAALFGAASEHFVDRHRSDKHLIKRFSNQPYHRSGVRWKVAPDGMCVNVTAVFRRSVVEEINGWLDWFCGADCEINTRLRRAGYQVIESNHLHGLRRLQNQSISNGPKYGPGKKARIKEDRKLKALNKEMTSGFDVRKNGMLDKHRGRHFTKIEPAKATPFAISSAGRDGSTLMMSSVNQHPKVFCRSEVLNPLVRDEIHPTDGEDIGDFLENHVYNAPRVEAAGCKLNSPPNERNDYGTPAYPYLKKIGAKIIFLRRENTLAQHVSRMIGLKTRQWTNIRGDKPTTKTIRLNTETLLSEIEAAHQEYARQNRELAELESLEVVYEDFIADYQGTMDRVFQFLGVDPIQITPPIHKQEHRPLSDVIENWGEVQESLNKTSMTVNWVSTPD